MKYFSIDEDIMNSLIDLITEAYLSCKAIGDDNSAMFYNYLIDELEHARCIGKSPDMSSEEQARMKKLERYLRMLQEGLKNPTDEKENKKRRDFASDILQPKKKKKPPIEEIKEIKPLTKKEILEQQFESYYQRREEKKAEKAFKEMCKEIGIEPYNKKDYN